MKVLITGGAGRLGDYVAKELEAAHELVLFDTAEPGSSKHPVHVGDVLSESDVMAALDGCDAVVHLAGIPILTPAHRDIWRVNADGTLNVLECMAAKGVRRIVFASSICAEGFINSATPMPVSRFPVDESYDGVPDDVYGLSKVAGELLCRGYVTRFGFTAFSLRLATILYPDIPQSVSRLERHAGADGARFLWNYVDARDAAQAVRLALNSSLVGHHAFHVGAGDTCSPTPSLELIRQFYSHGNPTFAAGFPTHAHEAVWSIDQIKEKLGYLPAHPWRQQ